jgi:hypothetical protein
MNVVAWIVTAVLTTLSASVVHADLVVPAGAQYSLSTGNVDLACTDIVVAGTLHLGAGTAVNVRNVAIQPGGLIDGGSGSLSLGGNWTNAGSFTSGTSTVAFRDICSVTTATLSGSNTFFSASFVSTTGKSYVLAAEQAQAVNSVLEIAGTSAQPIQLRSSAAHSVASLNLQTGGTQLIQHVGITDVWATGQWLAPGLVNEGGGGNASRWFGTVGSSTPIPTLADSWLIALMAMLAAVGGSRLYAGRRHKRSPLRIPEWRDPRTPL